MKWQVFVLAAMLVGTIIVACSAPPTPTVTPVPPTATHISPSPTAVLPTATATPPPSTPTPAGPKLGQWQTTTNFGRVTFRVGSDGVSFGTFEFPKPYNCGGIEIAGAFVGKGTSAAVIPEMKFSAGPITVSPPFPFEKIPFGPPMKESPKLTMSFEGKFNSSMVSGKYTAQYLGKSCSGTFSGKWIGATTSVRPSPPLPKLVVDPQAVYNPFCNCQKTARVGQRVFLSWSWAAATRELTQSFIDTSTFALWMDDSPTPILWSIGSANWTEITQEELGLEGGRKVPSYISDWVWQLPPLSPGRHYFQDGYALSKSLKDGFLDLKGQPYIYGPGVISNHWLAITIQ